MMPILPWHFRRRGAVRSLALLTNQQETKMRKLTVLATMAALAMTVAVPTFAVAAGNDIVMTDHSMRASKIIGATVYNDQGQGIGTVIDVLVKNTAAEPTAILSVGDYVGGGTKLVAVPLSHVNLDG